MFPRSLHLFARCSIIPYLLSILLFSAFLTHNSFSFPQNQALKTHMFPFLKLDNEHKSRAFGHLYHTALSPTSKLVQLSSSTTKQNTLFTSIYASLVDFPYIHIQLSLFEKSYRLILDTTSSILAIPSSECKKCGQVKGPTLLQSMDITQDLVKDSAISCDSDICSTKTCSNDLKNSDISWSFGDGKGGEACAGTYFYGEKENNLTGIWFSNDMTEGIRVINSQQSTPSPSQIKQDSDPSSNIMVLGVLDHSNMFPTETGEENNVHPPLGRFVDGIFGLSTSSLYCDKVGGSKCPSFPIQSILSHFQVASFALCYFENGGIFILGDPDDSTELRQELELPFAKMTDPDTYTIQLVSASVSTSETQTISQENTAIALLDTTSQVISMHPKLFDAFKVAVRKLPGICDVTGICPNIDNQQNPEADTIFNRGVCAPFTSQELNLLPTLTFEFTKTPNTNQKELPPLIELQPSQYFVEYKADDSNDIYYCLSIVSDESLATVGIPNLSLVLGSIAMQGYYIAIDSKNKRVGLAKSTSICNQGCSVRSDCNSCVGEPNSCYWCTSSTSRSYCESRASSAIDQCSNDALIFDVEKCQDLPNSGTNDYDYSNFYYYGYGDDDGGDDNDEEDDEEYDDYDDQGYGGGNPTDTEYEDNQNNGDYQQNGDSNVANENPKSGGNTDNKKSWSTTTLIIIASVVAGAVVAGFAGIVYFVRRRRQSQDVSLSEFDINITEENENLINDA